MYEDVIIEMARIEREAREAVRRKIAARQLGEAWIGLNETGEAETPQALACER
jgi:hypothetical protein